MKVDEITTVVKLHLKLIDLYESNKTFEEKCDYFRDNICVNKNGSDYVTCIVISYIIGEYKRDSAFFKFYSKIHLFLLKEVEYKDKYERIYKDSINLSRDAETFHMTDFKL